MYSYSYRYFSSSPGESVSSAPDIYRSQSDKRSDKGQLAAAGQSSCEPASSVGQSSCSKLAAAGHTNSDPAAAAPQLLTASEQLKRTEPLVLVLDTVMADLVKSTAVLTHVDSEGRANMVDVGHKGDTKRVAVASGTIFLGKQPSLLLNRFRNPLVLLYKPNFLDISVGYCCQFWLCCFYRRNGVPFGPGERPQEGRRVGRGRGGRDHGRQINGQPHPSLPSTRCEQYRY